MDFSGVTGVLDELGTWRFVGLSGVAITAAGEPGLGFGFCLGGVSITIDDLVCPCWKWDRLIRRDDTGVDGAATSVDRGAGRLGTRNWFPLNAGEDSSIVERDGGGGLEGVS